MFKKALAVFLAVLTAIPIVGLYAVAVNDKNYIMLMLTGIHGEFIKHSFTVIPTPATDI